MQAEFFPFADGTVVRCVTSVFFKIHQIIHVGGNQCNILGTLAGSHDTLMQVFAVLGDESGIIMTFYEIGRIHNSTQVTDIILDSGQLVLMKHATHPFEHPAVQGEDLFKEHEKYLTEEHFKSPVFVYDRPKEIKAFYMRMNEDGKTVAAADCLVPGIGEIIGGSQREERLDLLEARIKDLGMNPEQYKYYLDLRRYGSCKHAGYGLGFERLVMYLTGVGNIRDVLPHPRTVGNADF